MKQVYVFLLILGLVSISVGCGQTTSNPIMPANSSSDWSNWDGEFSFSPSGDRLYDDHFEIRWRGHSDHPPFRVVVDPRTTGSAPGIETIVKTSDYNWGKYDYVWYCIPNSDWFFWIDEAKYLVKVVLIDTAGHNTGQVLASHYYEYRD